MESDGVDDVIEATQMNESAALKMHLHATNVNAISVGYIIKLLKTENRSSFTPSIHLLSHVKVRDL